MRGTVYGDKSRPSLPVILLGVDVQRLLFQQLWAGERDPLAARPRHHHDNVPAPALRLTRDLDHRVCPHLTQQMF